MTFQNVWWSCFISWPIHTHANLDSETSPTSNPQDFIRRALESRRVWWPPSTPTLPLRRPWMVSLPRTSGVPTVYLAPPKHQMNQLVQGCPGYPKPFCAEPVLSVFLLSGDLWLVVTWWSQHIPLYELHKLKHTWSIYIYMYTYSTNKIPHNWSSCSHVQFLCTVQCSGFFAF